MALGPNRERFLFTLLTGIRPSRLTGRLAWQMAIIFVVSLLFIGVVAASIEKRIHDSEAVREGLLRARASSVLNDDLGSPVKEGWLITGHLGGDRVHLFIPLKGPKGAGSLELEAVLDRGRWDVRKLYLSSESGRGDDLLSHHRVR